MPDFIAALLATIVFLVALTVLNALTRLADAAMLIGLDEGSFVQIGCALLLARMAWQARLRPEPARGGAGWDRKLS